MSIMCWEAEDLYEKEKHRCATYLHSSTEPKLLKETMLIVHAYCNMA